VRQRRWFWAYPVHIQFCSPKTWCKSAWSPARSTTQPYSVHFCVLSGVITFLYHSRSLTNDRQSLHSQAQAVRATPAFTPASSAPDPSTYLTSWATAARARLHAPAGHQPPKGASLQASPHPAPQIPRMQAWLTGGCLIG
jgi:hypothetical protein